MGPEGNSIQIKGTNFGTSGGVSPENTVKPTVEHSSVSEFAPDIKAGQEQAGALLNFTTTFVDSGRKSAPLGVQGGFKLDTDYSAYGLGNLTPEQKEEFERAVQEKMAEYEDYLNGIKVEPDSIGVVYMDYRIDPDGYQIITGPGGKQYYKDPITGEIYSEKPKSLEEFFGEDEDVDGAEESENSAEEGEDSDEDKEIFGYRDPRTGIIYPELPPGANPDDYETIYDGTGEDEKKVFDEDYGYRLQEL